MVEDSRTRGNLGGTKATSPHEGRVEGAGLAEGLEEGDARGVREVQGSHGADRGDSDGAIGEAGDELVGEAHALFAEHEGVARREARRGERRGGRGREQVELALGGRGGERAEERVEVGVVHDVDEVPIVDPGAAHRVLVDAEPELAHEVERALRGGAEARDAGAEQAVLAELHATRAFIRAVDGLRDDVDRLEARLRLLEPKRIS